MLNETLYMQTRLFRLFCNQNKIESKRANDLFLKYKIWDYIDKCYGLLHLSSDESALDDIDKILSRNGVVL